MPNWQVWNDPIWQRYAVAVGGLLLIVGVLLLVLRHGFGKNTASLSATYRGWLIMAPLVLGCVALGRFAVIALVTALSFAAFREFARATQLLREHALSLVVYAAVLGVGVVAAVPDPRLERTGWYGLFIALPVYVIAILLIVPIVRNRPQGQLQQVSLAIVGFLYFGWMFGHLAFLTNLPGAVGYVLYLFFAVSLNDVAAFTFGKLFGRRKLREHISPNKTIGGSLGALGTSLLLPWLLGFSFPQFGATTKILVGLIVGIGGQLGDLTISFMKRDLAIKDMGTLIPGHGGILDRVDSLIFTAPLFFHLVRWLYDA